MMFYSFWQHLSKTECGSPVGSAPQYGCSSVFPALSGDDHIQPGDWRIADILHHSSSIQRDRLHLSSSTGLKPRWYQTAARQAKLWLFFLWLDHYGRETSLERFYMEAF